ncbi:Atg14 domain-containing protein [Brevibacillus sp. MER 51]|uniref:Atg14 domain-containing protein n=1 Tax=Brevibacillus sp. MER 51 TaxID=2939560 RepID=UPI002040A581|nr:Atg14 domain-containing protein [Brevibacillus sp. MER 51]MCM3141673.1 Atg14 domain-containing protein [Brevibacillus sp. MER 51]
MSLMENFDHTYNELIMEIDVLETRIKDLVTERRFLLKSMDANAPKGMGAVDYSRDRVQSNFVPFPLERIIERMNKIDETIEQLREQLKAKRETLRQLDSLLSQMDGLEYKVAFMRDKLNMKLHEIAEKLGYSHDHIRRISSRMKKMPHRCHIQHKISSVN